VFNPAASPARPCAGHGATGSQVTIRRVVSVSLSTNFGTPVAGPRLVSFGNDPSRQHLAAVRERVEARIRKRRRFILGASHTGRMSATGGKPKFAT
jgi:hypothetical protein